MSTNGEIEVNVDFLQLGNSLMDTMEKAGFPATEDQAMLIHGGLYVYQQMILDVGLPELIERLKNSEATEISDAAKH